MVFVSGTHTASDPAWFGWETDLERWDVLTRGSDVTSSGVARVQAVSGIPSLAVRGIRSEGGSAMLLPPLGSQNSARYSQNNDDVWGCMCAHVCIHV